MNDDMNDVSRHNARAAKNRNVLIVIMAVLVLLLAAIAAFLFMKMDATDAALAQERNAREQAELNLEQERMQYDFNQLNEQFVQIENQRIVIMDDSVKRDLTEKYEAAKLKMERLQQELNNQRQKSAEEIKQLKGQIETLRELLRQYLAQIDQLNQENQALREENQDLRNDNTRLNNQVAQTTKQNEQLSERMTLAERLNVTGLSLTALNKKGKQEKKVSKAVQLRATFTIPQNNSTPVGEKTIYMRILSPSGQLLGNDGTFTLDGTNVVCTAKKAINYEGLEITGINIYWDVNTALTPGEYTVELFADNFRLISRTFNLN